MRLDREQERGLPACDAERVDLAAEKANRRAMREATGTDEIPLLVRDDGTQLSDWHEMLDWIRATYDRPDDADRHREKWFEEASERDPNHVLT